MAARSNGLRFVLLGMGGLSAAIGLTGCSFVWESRDASVPATTSGRVSSGRSRSVSETFRKNYAALKVKTLRVRDEMGAIEIKPVEEGRDEIRIEATKTVEGSRFSDADLKKLLTKVKITASLDGDALVIEADHVKDDFPDNVSATVAFVIAVPKRLALDLRTDNSPITATGSAGDATTASLHSNNGKVTFAPTTFALAKADIETDNAGITVTMPTALSATVDAHTSNGNVTLDGVSDSADKNSDSDHTDRHVVLNSGKASIVARTSNGSISLESR